MRGREGVLESCDMNDEERTSHGMNRGTVMTAAALMPWNGRVISSSAFNLSTQVLRFLTFRPCGSPLPLSASDSYGAALCSTGACVLKMHSYCLRACACVFQLYDPVCVCVPLIPWVPQSHSGLVQETRFDTSIVEITCVQTVIALQTIRTAITHF